MTWPGDTRPLYVRALEARARMRLRKRIFAGMGGRRAHALGRAHKWTPEEQRAATAKAVEARRAKAGGQRVD